MRRLLFSLLLTVSAIFCEAPDTSKFEMVLHKFVGEDGRVDYAGLRKNSGALDEFVSQMATISPDTRPALFPTRRHRLAYWLNAYNALVLKAFSRDYPEKRLRLKTPEGITEFFYEATHRVGGKPRTLSDIEDRSIRAFGDPRIHFAIVCASASCPWLSRTPYTAENVEAQLERETARYFAQDRNFRLDEARKEVWLGEILKWFSADFGRSRSAVLGFVAKYRTAEANKLRSGKYQLRYVPYDWNPNDLR